MKLLATAGQRVEAIDDSTFKSAPEAERRGIKQIIAVRDGAGLVDLYDRDGRMRHVPAQVLGHALEHGLMAECPHCNGTHESDDPNACPVLAPLPFVVCEICGKRVYDSVRPGAEKSFKTDDPNEIVIEGFQNTPEARLRALKAAHIVAKHRNEAIAMGLPDRDAQGR